MNKKSVYLIAVCSALLVCSCGKTDGLEAAPSDRIEEATETEQSKTDAGTENEEVSDKQMLSDIDGNGETEYALISGEGHDRLTFYYNNEPVYEHEDPCYIDMGEVQYVDLDGDGEKEIFMTIQPHVNSMPLTEYAVLKQTDGAWHKLETYQGETIDDNAFPIHVRKGSGPFDAVITCDGLAKQIETDVQEYGRYLKEEAAQGEEESRSFYEDLIHQYENVFVHYEEGEDCGSVCAWGIWDVEISEYEGNPCIAAGHGIQGFDKSDYWGEVTVSFDYDEAGKIRILDMQFQPDERFLPDHQLPEREAWGELLWRVYQQGKLPDGTRLDYVGEEQAASNHFSYMDIDGDGKDELILSWENTSMAGMATRVFGYGQGEFYEELCEFPSLTFYDNGIVIADWSHNQGLAGDFWPYNMYRYDAETDAYTSLGSVDAWDRSLGEQNWDGTLFPEDVDADGDGMVYFILPPDWDGYYNDPVDGVAYQAWYDEHMNGAIQITIPFQELTEEAIAAFGYPRPDLLKAEPLG